VLRASEGDVVADPEDGAFVVLGGEGRPAAPRPEGQSGRTRTRRLEELPPA
jgi:hypothetical protein